MPDISILQWNGIPLGAKGIFIYQSPMSMISGHTCKWMYNNSSILVMKMDAMSLVGGIWYMHN